MELSVLGLYGENDGVFSVFLIFRVYLHVFYLHYIRVLAAVRGAVGLHSDGFIHPPEHWRPIPGKYPLNGMLSHKVCSLLGPSQKRVLLRTWRMPPKAAYPPPPRNLPPVRPVLPQGGGNGHEVMDPPFGGGGGAPQICTVVSQCKLASARCRNFLWCLRRRVFPMLSGPGDRSPPRGGGARGGVCRWEGISPFQITT